MVFILFKDLTNLEYYVDIPEPPIPADGRIEEFYLEESDLDPLLEDFVPAMWNLVDSLLDNGDVDYFNKDKCIKMKPWLENRIKADIPERLKFLYTKLLDYVNRAIQLGTGVEIEL